MKTPDKKLNRLASEKSPYLLQHSTNPVDWFPWSEEAFVKAKSENKMIFLSIGYATCHWCHVMEKESFENETTAEVLNKDYVSIKVDREERPDVDRIYMDALHAMGQQGGWPLNMFLTPEGKPITGGTYFPPVPKYGRKSFTEVLGILIGLWKDKKEELLEASEDLTKHLKESEETKALTDTSELSAPGSEVFENGFLLYDRLYDPEYAGFKSNSVNKFPPSMGLSFLLRYHKSTGEPKALEMVEETLTAMKKGGIYDQIGGGLCRYSTDHHWLVPHFEKMLYDNSLFLEALVECYQAVGEEKYKDYAYDVIEYLHRDMRLQGGGIASAEDADSEGEEGLFYLWTKEEIREVCGQDSSLLDEFWNITEKGNFEEKNILHETFRMNFSRLHGLEPSELEEIVSRNRKKLLEKRSSRIRPLRDDKILFSWNCLYIKALTKAAMAFGDGDLLREAEETYKFLENNLIREDGRLLRRFREGEARFLAYSTDYAEFVLASLYLFQAGKGFRYLENAVRYTEEAIRLFRSPSGVFFDSGIDGEALLRRTVDGYDGVEPSANSSFATAFVLLSKLGVVDSEKYLQYADLIFSYFKPEMETYPMNYPYMLSALWLRKSPGRELAVVYTSQEELLPIWKGVGSLFLPETVLVWANDKEAEENGEKFLLLRNRNSGGGVKAYVCVGFHCELPVSDWASLRAKLVED
ncbi:thioredoxin domain-containing protein [Leptospira selangorensis]|uniref:Thioredoxin domain-containing protein n=1 Tax=Leptospira selangorensis TaxID=2484982 RepID=A0A5F2BYS4_9LEPT|nr:thioredoxin domain-containing protein [Leptospira selangorensis]TGM12247.1 thioredoxin domain-containing protein [Leptospira selangorensis]TGM14710.1 thioredoxin domain-containing protein [Leptospira selangorensis]